MRSLDELSETVETALTMVGADGETLERRASSTIVPEARRIDTGGRRALELLERLEATRRARTGRELELHDTIGEGGMGVVRLATQHALGRTVAVKTLKAEHRGELATLKLLREAWVTGGLEHPNVVPVYDIAVESDGSPLIVLKKIEGDEWAELMHDAAAVKQRFGSEDLLEWNLRTLMQVCNAVRFAHSRQILHRDLKPENVMIGSFGEVYLVDWGIAVSLADDGEGWLPLAREATEMAGTPLYMAPEMLGGPESRLSARTDVYLLGAILCEIVTGAPPHRGEKLMQIVSSIVDSDPDLGDAPAELARIVRRAMDADPDARFENAEQLRLALSGYLQHRDAARLAERAEARLAALREMLEAPSAEADDHERREAIYRVFGECRFGFRHALEVWPDNAPAREGLDRALSAMVEYELAQEEPEAARTLLGEMAHAPEPLAARVDEARRRREAEDAELRRVSADLDPSAGRRTRAFIALIVGVLWVLMPLGAGVAALQGWQARSNAVDAIYASFFLCLLAGLGYWARDSMTRTAINRRIGIAGLVAMSTQLLASLVALVLDLPPGAAIQHGMLAFATLCFMLAASVDMWLALSGLAYAAGYVVCVAVGHELLVVSACNLVLLATMLRRWGRREDLEVARLGIERRQARRHQRIARRLGRGG